MTYFENMHTPLPNIPLQQHATQNLMPALQTPTKFGLKKLQTSHNTTVLWRVQRILNFLGGFNI